MTGQGILFGVALGIVHWSLFVRSIRHLATAGKAKTLTRLSMALAFSRTLMTLILGLMIVRHGLATVPEIVTGILLSSVGFRAVLHKRLHG